MERIARREPPKAAKRLAQMLIFMLKSEIFGENIKILLLLVYFWYNISRLGIKI